MSPLLVIVAGPSKLDENISLVDKRVYTFGRTAAADICLAEKKISRKHASIFYDSDLQQVVLEDFGSLNGTFVNGEVLLGKTFLKDKDTFQIGSFAFQLILNPSDVTEVETKVQSRSEESAELFFEDPSEVNNQTGGRMISGRLKDLALGDLLQLLANTRKTGRLVLSKKKLAVLPTNPKHSDLASIYIEDGEIAFVEFENLKNEEAFFQILKWKIGYFSLFPHADFNFPERLQYSVEALLLEGYRRLDEEKANQEELDDKDSFDINLNEPLTNLNEDQLKIFQSVWKHRSVRPILKASALNEAKTKEILRQLMKLEFIKKI